MSKPYLVALGTACFDEYYSADSWVSEGDKLLVHPMEKKAVGMVANAASVMAGYGNSVYLVDFMNGGASNQELKENLASFGLNTSHIVTDDRLPDAKCIIVLTPKERTIFVLDFPRPKRVLPPQTQALLENAAYIYTTMAEIRRFENYEALLDSWRGAGAKIVFDLESTTFEDSSDVLFSKADVLLFNDIGLEKYAAGRDPDACIQALLDDGCTAVVTTLGADGCDCRTKDCHVRLPGHKVSVVDTTGAGDTFNASFTHCLLHGMDPESAAKFSNAAAARAVTILGPRGGVAPVSEVEAFLAQHQ